MKGKVLFDGATDRVLLSFALFTFFRPREVFVRAYVMVLLTLFLLICIRKYLYNTGSESLISFALLIHK